MKKGRLGMDGDMEFWDNSPPAESGGGGGDTGVKDTS